MNIIVKIIQRHPLFVISGIVIAAFTAGIGFDMYFQRTTYREMRISNAQVQQLINEHNKKIAILHKQYIKYEEEAASSGHIDEYRQRYVNSANRVKDLIDSENESFTSQLEKLQNLSTGELE